MARRDFSWYSHRDTVKRQKGNYFLFLVLPKKKKNTKHFKQKEYSMINTPAITAVTKFSIKPWSGATKNYHLCGSGERNGEQRRTKVSFGKPCASIGAAAVSEKAHLGMKRHWTVKKSSP